MNFPINCPVGASLNKQAEWFYQYHSALTKTTLTVKGPVVATPEPTLVSVNFQPRPGTDGVAARYLLWRIAQKTLVCPSGCWEWSGTSNAKGYGLVHLKRRSWPESTVSLHRLIYEICVEQIPEGFHVLHRCDNPSCLRPDHLFIGSNLDNIADKMAKGRHRSPRGEMHGMAKMNSITVRMIRSRAAAGESYSSIARDIGFSSTQVSAVARGKSWSHLS